MPRFNFPTKITFLGQQTYDLVSFNEISNLNHKNSQGRLMNKVKGSVSNKFSTVVEKSCTQLYQR